MKRNLC